MTAKISFDRPGDIWFFAYGSLMWDPGFAFAEARSARLFGYHRKFCVDSTVYRGTPETPGLVLGLDRGGSCHGIAYRIAQSDRQAAALYLSERELAEAYYCKRATEIYDSYVNAPRLYKTNEDGEREYLSKEDTARTISETRAQKDKACRNSGGRS